MSKCDIKTSAQAWNDGVEAFKKAFKQTGGKTTESIQFAMSEIHRQHPDVDFEVNSFVDPLVSSLKEKGVIGAAYKFREVGKVSGAQKRIEKVAEKMKGLDDNQKKKFAKEAFKTFEKDGTFTEESVKNIYSDALGIPAMNEALEKQISELAKARQAANKVQNEIDKAIREMQEAKTANNGKLTPEQDKEYTDRFEKLAKDRKVANDRSMKEGVKFANMLQEKRFWLHQLTDYMPLNLMNPNSLIKNISGAVADGFVRTMGNVLASPISQAASIFTKINSNPVGARTRGAIRATVGPKSTVASKAAAAWKYGSTEFENELPRANLFDAAGRIKKAMDDTGFEKFKGILSGILKIHPNIISKALSTPDAAVYEMEKASELFRIAQAKKLSGAELEAFMMQPDEKSEEIASDLAKRATFKQDLPKWLDGIRKLSAYDPHEAAKKLIAEGVNPKNAKYRTGIRAFLQKSAAPFIRTPINILRTSSSILLPEYEFADSMIKAYKEKDPIEKQRLIIDGTTRAVAGMLVRQVAIQLVVRGLMSAGYDDEDKKTKDFVEQELGGPNRVNYSALVRGLTFRNMNKRKGDNYVDLNSLGALGISLAVYAHAYGKMSEDEIKDRAEYNKSLLNAITIPYDLSTSSLAASLDFTFFSGVNQLQGAILNRGGHERDRVAVNYLANLFTGVAPSTYQKLSTQASPLVKKQFDADLSFHENLVNTLGYRFAFQSDGMKNKYFSLAEKNKALKRKQYMLFDNYLGRVLEAEFDFAKVTKAKDNEDPVSRLHQASRQVPMEERDKLFPASIGKEQSIQYKKGGKRKSYKAELTDEQHGYLQEQASVYRMMLATPFIMSKDFENADHEMKTKILQSYYQEGLKMAKQDLRRTHPEISEQRVEGTDAKTVRKIAKKYKVKPE